MPTEKCAPSKKHENNSCFTLEALVKITNAFNSSKIAQKSGKIPMIYNKSYLVKELTKKLENVCDDQMCWLRQQFVKDIKDKDIHENTFRPEGPANNLKWLNTDNINKVIHQYCDLHPDFKFFGAVPIDFDDLEFYGIKKLNYNALLKEGIKKIGFVFNLDEHWKSGSHWVSMFANIDTGHIYFFDSFGIIPEKRIRNLIKRIGKFCYKKNEKKPTMKYNRVRHQFKNTECGVYSTNFILRLLSGESFEDITLNITKDDKISQCRKEYFN
jgi:hypothetical protein